MTYINISNNNKCVLKKHLTLPKKSLTGRNKQGKLVFRTRGGGGKKCNLQLIDFYRLILNIPAIVIKLCYGNIGTRQYIKSSLLISYKHGVLAYNITYNNYRLGDIILNSEKKFLYKSGDSTLLKNMLLGALVYNLSNNIHKLNVKKGIYGRALGSFLKLTLQKKFYSVLILKSKEIKLFNSLNTCNIGVVSNLNLKNYYKPSRAVAGHNRRLGFRPIVRGVAKNPVDHPNGGRTKGGKVFKSPWGLIATGGRTVIRANNKFIIQRRFKNFS